MAGWIYVASFLKNDELSGWTFRYTYVSICSIKCIHTYTICIYIYIYRIRWMDSWSTQAIPVKRGLPIGVARSTVSDWSATSPSEFFA